MHQVIVGWEVGETGEVVLTKRRAIAENKEAKVLTHDQKL